MYRGPLIENEVLYNFSAAVLCLVAQSCLILCDSMDCSRPSSSVHGDSLGKNMRVGCHALLRGGLSNLGIEPRPPILQADSLLSEPPGKPYNFSKYY